MRQSATDAYDRDKILKRVCIKRLRVMPQAKINSLITEKGLVSVCKIPKLDHVTCMNFTEVIKNLRQCPFSELFGEYPAVIRTRIKSLRQGKLALSNMVIRWSQFRPFSTIEE